MGLFNEIDEIAQKQNIRSDIGNNIISGIIVGTVTENYNKEYPGRVCVEIPQRDKGANVLKWARVALPYVGKKWGTYYIPEIGDQVLLAFEDGNIEKPFVIGCVPTANSTFISSSSDEYNQKKVITSRNGNSITIIDANEGDGEKDKISIKTAKDEFHVLLDNENHKLEISDKEKKNSIVFNSENGTVRINAEKKLDITVGDAAININGESNKIGIKCGKMKLSSDDSIKTETSMFKLEAQNVNISASSTFKAEGGSTAVVNGQVVKIG